MTTNNNKDLFTTDSISLMWSVVEANHDHDVELVNPWYTPTLKMDESWYEKLPVSGITVTAAGNEIFRDDCVQIGELLKVSCSSLPEWVWGPANLLLFLLYIAQACR